MVNGYLKTCPLWMAWKVEMVIRKRRKSRRDTRPHLQILKGCPVTIGAGGVGGTKLGLLKSRTLHGWGDGAPCRVASSRPYTSTPWPSIPSCPTWTGLQAQLKQACQAWVVAAQGLRAKQVGGGRAPRRRWAAGLPGGLSGARISGQRHGSVCWNLLRAASGLPGQIIANKIDWGLGSSYKPLLYKRKARDGACRSRQQGPESYKEPVPFRTAKILASEAFSVWCWWLCLSLAAGFPFANWEPTGHPLCTWPALGRRRHRHCLPDTQEGGHTLHPVAPTDTHWFRPGVRERQWGWGVSRVLQKEGGGSML